MNQFQRRQLKTPPKVEEDFELIKKKQLTKTEVVSKEQEPPVEVSHKGSQGNDFLTEGLE